MLPDEGTESIPPAGTARDRTWRTATCRTNTLRVCEAEEERAWFQGRRSNARRRGPLQPARRQGRRRYDPLPTYLTGWY